MVLDVDDFGCVPDGRSLDRAFIAEGKEHNSARPFSVTA